MSYCFYCKEKVRASHVVGGKPACRRHHETDVMSPVDVPKGSLIAALPHDHVTLAKLEEFFEFLANMGGKKEFVLAGSTAFLMMMEDEGLFATKDIDMMRYSGIDVEAADAALDKLGIRVFLDNKVHADAPPLDDVEMTEMFYGRNQELAVNLPEPGWLFYAKIKAWRAHDQEQCRRLWEKHEWGLGEAFSFAERFNPAKDRGIVEHHKVRMVFLAQRWGLVDAEELEGYPAYGRDDAESRYG